MPETTPEFQPKYDSPIKWEIKNGKKLWEQVKNGIPTPPGSVAVGPELGDLGYEPLLYFSPEGDLTLSLECRKNKLGYFENYSPPNLEEILRQYVDPRLRVRDHEIFRTRDDSEKDLEYICSLGADIRYNPRDTRITTPEKFLEELTLALKIYRVVVTEVHRAEGLEPPQITVIIQPTERPISPIKTESLFDIFKGAELELVRRAVVIEELPSVSFEDIGGQEQAVNLAKRLALQIKNPEAFEKWGVSPPRAILFEGPPGTGKTLTAKALAREAGAAVLVVRGSDIYDMWFGQSEKMTKALFELALELGEEKGHCLVIIDEADQLLVSRQLTTHHATASVVSEFNQAIDGLRESGKITVILLSNYPERIDNAILSRCEATVHFDLPQDRERAQIFQIHFQKATQKARRSLVDPEIDWNKIDEASEGLSGRDIADIVSEVLRVKGEQESLGQSPGPVTTQEILDMIKTSEKTLRAKREIEQQARATRPIGFILPSK